MLTDEQDAYGHEIYDYYRGKGGYEIVEREDGYIDISSGPPLYFSDYRNWPPHLKKAMKFVHGRVLDIGCGAGRADLYLQKKGFDVTGIDNSPLAVLTAEKRGAKKVLLMPVSNLRFPRHSFGTILMLGNNFGLMGGRARGRRLLRRFYDLTDEAGVLIAESGDPYCTDNSCHLEYHRFNRERKRMPGQLRLRVRYQKYKTPWFDYLIVSRHEMEEMLTGTGWYVSRFLDSAGPPYVAIIKKSPERH